MESKEVNYDTLGPGLLHKAAIELDRQYVTQFIWTLNDWTLLHGTYSQGILSESFALDGVDQYTCRLFLNPEDSNNPFAILFSDTDCILAMKVMIYVNDKEQFQSSYLQPVPRILHPPGIIAPLEECNLNELLKSNSLYRADRSLKIAVWFFITKNREAFTHSYKKRRTNIGEKTRLMLDHKKFCDVTFVFDDKEIPAHKAVLAAQSKVFEAMFVSAMIEKDTNRVKIVDITAEVFEEFLKYLYTGEANDLENIVEYLLIVADKYQVSDLRELCENYMLRNISAVNAVKYLIIADKVCCDELKKKALEILETRTDAWKRGIKNESIETLICLKEVLSNVS